VGTPKLDAYGVDADVLAKPTGARAALESKVNPAVLDVFDCWKRFVQDCKFLKDGKLEVQLWLTRNSGVAATQLSALGFTVLSRRSGGTVLVGRLPVQNLEELVKISAVRFVSLVRR